MYYIFINGLTERQKIFFSDGWTPIIHVRKTYLEEDAEKFIKDWLGGRLKSDKNITLIRSNEKVDIHSCKFKIKGRNFSTFREYGE